MTVEDSKVEDLRVAAFAGSTSLLQVFVRAGQANRLAFGEGRYLYGAGLVRVFIVLAASTQAGCPVVVFCRLERDANDGRVAACGRQDGGLST